MKLIDDWKWLAPRLWSVRFALLAAVLGTVETAVTWWGSGKPPIMVLGITLASLAAGIARVVAQPKLLDAE